MTGLDLLLVLVFFLFTSVGIRWWVNYLEWHTLPIIVDKQLKELMIYPTYPLWLAVVKYAVAFLGHIFFVWIIPLGNEVSIDALILFEFFAIVSGSFLGALFYFLSSYYIDKQYHKKYGRHLTSQKIVCHVVDEKCVTPLQLHFAYSVLLGAVIFISGTALIIWLPLLIDIIA